MSNERFFIIHGNGFGRYSEFSGCTGKGSGTLHVRSFAETKWVLAGVSYTETVEENLISGRWVEFSPASLLASVPSLARSRSARLNGSKGGRPRKAVG